MRAGNGWEGFHKTREAMLELDAQVVAALRAEGVEAVPVQPSSACSARDGAPVRFATGAIRALLRAGAVPVIFGDAVPDSARGFTILSTEALFTALAGALKPAAVLELSDVPGIFRWQPGDAEGSRGRGEEGGRGRRGDGATKRRGESNLLLREPGILVREVIPVFGRGERESFRASAGRGADVTGGIASKARLLMELAERLPRAEVRLLSGLDPGAVEKALLGGFDGGTLFRSTCEVVERRRSKVESRRSKVGGRGSSRAALAEVGTRKSDHPART